MRQASLRIFLSANLVIYLIFAIALFPEGFGWGILAVIWSAAFSAPTLPVLFAGFALLQRLKPRLAGCWLFLVLLIGTCAFIPQLLINLFDGGKFRVAGEFFLLSLGGAVGGTLLQSFYLHQFFKPFSHDCSSPIEIN